MPDTCRTTGQKEIDLEFDALLARLVKLEARSSGGSTNTVPVPINTSSGLPTGVVFRQVGQTTLATADVVEVDPADGHAVTQTGNTARLDRTPGVTAPTSQSVAGTPGVATASANSDHAHAPVVTTKGDLLGRSTLPARLPVGADGDIIYADSSQALGVKWDVPPVGTTPILTTKGDLLGFDTAEDRIPVGANGEILYADSAQTLGVRWDAAPAGTAPVLTTKGDLLGFDTAENRFPVGANGEVIYADSSQALGVKWDALPAAVGINFITATGATYAAAGTDDVILAVNASGCAVTLPAASSRTAGKQLTIISDTLLGTTVTRAGSDTINGVTSKSLSTIYDMMILFSDGVSAWYASKAAGL